MAAGPFIRHICLLLHLKSQGETLVTNWNILFPLLVTTLVAIVGWFVAHRLAAARDRANKRREFRISFLIDAYRRLEFSSRRQHDSETVKALESALADIQLMGSPEQVALISPYLKELNMDPTSAPGPLLELLRKELRRELKLQELSDGGVIVRMNSTVYNVSPDKDVAK